MTLQQEILFHNRLNKLTQLVNLNSSPNLIAEECRLIWSAYHGSFARAVLANVLFKLRYWIGYGRHRLHIHYLTHRGLNEDAIMKRVFQIKKKEQWRNC